MKKMYKSKQILLFDLDDTLFDSTNQPEDTGNKWSISVFEGVKSFLVSNKYQSILVTRGNVERQNRKIDILGIKKYFSDIYIVENDELKNHKFKSIIKEYPNNTLIVIGNRIDCEIRYGNLLGLKTIHVEHGKHKIIVAKDEYEIPTIRIKPNDFFNLETIIKNLS